MYAIVPLRGVLTIREGFEQVAASGFICANTIAPVAKHLDALKRIDEMMAKPGGAYSA